MYSLKFSVNHGSTIITETGDTVAGAFALAVASGRTACGISLE